MSRLHKQSFECLDCTNNKVSNVPISPKLFSLCSRDVKTKKFWTNWQLVVVSFANLLPIRWPFRSLSLQVHCTCRAKKYSYSEAQNATLVLAQGLASCIFLFHPLCFSVVKKSIIFVLQGLPRGRSWGNFAPFLRKLLRVTAKKCFQPTHPLPPPTPTLSQYSAPTLSTNLRGP